MKNRHPFKILLLGILLASLAGCASTRKPLEIDMDKYGGLTDPGAKSGAILIAKQAIDVYDNAYLSSWRHKAMAQSKNGAWGWSHNQSTEEQAMDLALANCRRNNGSREDDNPCQIVTVDNFWAAYFKPKP